MALDPSPRAVDCFPAEKIEGKNTTMSTRATTKAEDEEIWNAFQLFDPQGTGTISVEDVRDALEDSASPRCHALLQKLSTTTSETLNFEEFRHLLTQRHDDELSDYERMFVLFDTDRKGYITLPDLRRIAQELGETMDTEELQEMIGARGKVTLEEFTEIMNRKLWS